MAGQRSLEPRMVRVRIPLPEPDDERLWSSGKTLRRQRGDRRFNSGQPLHDFDSGCVLAGVAERAMHLIRNEDNAGSIPAASSRKYVRPYE
jgi:hypothetical protein